jgi:hypothetical protein
MTPIRLSGSTSTKLAGQSHLFARFVLILLFATASLVPAALQAQTVYEGNASGNTIEGTATVESCAGCLNGTRVGNIGNGNANYLRIKNISVPTTGTYVIALYYTEGTDGGARSFTIQVNNGAGPTLSNLTGTSWTVPAAPVIFTAAFTAGSTNSIGFFNATDAAPNVDHITVSAAPLETSSAPTMLSPNIYEGDASTNTFAGSATVESCTGCLDNQRVSMLGDGSVNSLTINGISVPTTGVYSVTLYYVAGADAGTRSFDVQFSNGTDLSLNNLTGTSWDAPAPPVIFLANFTAGSNNSIKFLNANGPTPDIDHIVVTGSARGNAGIATPPPTSGGAADVGIGSSMGDGSSGFAAPLDIAQNLVNDYVPQMWCGLVGQQCFYYFYDRQTKIDSPTYGALRWARLWTNGRAAMASRISNGSLRRPATATTRSAAASWRCRGT